VSKEIKAVILEQMISSVTKAVFYLGHNVRWNFNNNNNNNNNNNRV
jgi:hypothetical protein